jgi:thiol:disulfide interchange protein DsbD
MMLLAATLLLGQSVPKCSVELRLVNTQDVAGSTIAYEVQFSPQPGWHLYWKNPGDSGQPIAINWKLPKGWTSGPLRWPAPERIDSAGSVSYGYTGKPVLQGTLRVPAKASGSIKLSAEVGWMACNDLCVIESKAVDLTFTVGPKKLNPRFPYVYPMPLSGVKGSFTDGVYTLVLPPTLGPESETPTDEKNVYFFCETEGTIAHNKPQATRVVDGRLTLGVPQSEYADVLAKFLSGVLKVGDRHFQVLVPVELK